MSPKGYVLFNSYAIGGGRGGLGGSSAEAEEDQALTVPIGTHVLFNAVKAEQAIEDGKRYKYYVATQPHRMFCRQSPERTAHRCPPPTVLKVAP